MARKRVLFYTEGWGTGGIEAVILGVLKTQAFREARMDFDIFSVCEWNDSYDATIERLGGRHLVRFPQARPIIFKKMIHGTREFSRILAAGDYSVVHVNATNGMSLVYSSIARRRGVPVRVVHSHNSYFDDISTHPFVKKLGHRLGKALLSRSATARIACSEAAGKFLFDGRPFEVVPNGIDPARFAFDAEKRRAVRSRLKVSESSVLLGNVGRVDDRKNPMFQVRLLAALRERGLDARYLMVGDGDLKDETMALAREMGVADSLAILPATSEPEAYYCALDALVMPSTTEGFGMTAIEAQCAGLPVVASDALPESVVVTDIIRRISLVAPMDEWAAAVEEFLSRGIDRAGYARIMGESAYNVERTAARMVGLWEAG